MSADEPLNAVTANSRFGGASFSLRHRATRAIWGIAWFLLAAWTPPPLRRWRILLLRLFGADVAPTARVYGSTRIWYPGNLAMGDHAVMGPGVICYSMAPISIGARATVSQRAHLCAGTHAVDDPHFQLIAKPITIGADAWIAAEAFIGPGVTVGDGAVAGARAVCMRDLDPFTIYAGNPAKPVRKRDVAAGWAAQSPPTSERA